jgi:hypothetical protein
MADELLRSGAMEVLQIAMAILGALSVFLGYRLFCDIAPFVRFAPNTGRMLSGALLALFGMAILSVDLIGFRSHVPAESRPATHHTKPAGLNRHAASSDWFV